MLARYGDWDDCNAILNNAIMRTDRFDGVSQEETTDAVITRIELPGVLPADVSVHAIDRRITVEYVKRKRTVALGLNVRSDCDAAATTARLERGVLELRTPKASMQTAKRIDVEVR